MTRQRWRQAALIVGGWTLVALFLFTKNLAARMLRQDPSPWEDILLAWLIGSYASAALTPAILWLGDRYPFGRERWARPLAIHLVGSAVFAVAQLYLEAVVTAWTGVVSFPVAQSVGTYFPVLLALGFHGGVLCYWLIIGLQSLWRFHESARRHEREALELMARASALETQVVQARLGALKMQLQPHFLFNTLNAVVSLVRARRGREAEDTLAHLSDLLRWVLDDSEHQEVPLARELEYVRLYLAVERVRFADRLRVDMRIAPDALDAAVPHLCLQPIVENAIRHGVEASASAGELVIGGRRVGATLELVVEDDGPGFRSLRQPVGIGLANTRLRLAELYGDRASMTMANALDGGAIVTLTLPFRECEEPAARSGAEPQPRKAAVL
jgi:two-component system LytT family sensor kinase